MSEAIVEYRSPRRVGCIASHHGARGSAPRDKLPAAAEAVWAAPVKTSDDVIARAELAAWWNDEELCDGFKSLDDPGAPILPEPGRLYDERSVGELIAAVFAMASTQRFIIAGCQTKRPYVGVCDIL